MLQRTTRFSLAVALVCLLLLPTLSLAAEGKTWPMTLRNNSGSAITGITFTPVNNDPQLTAAGPEVTVNQRLENKAQGVFQRPEHDLLRVVITTEAGTLSFVYVSYFQEEATTAELKLTKIKTPELAFYDGKDARAAFTGHNSVWGVKTPFNDFPYGPGQTTLAQAEALGGLKPGKTPEQRVGTIVWDTDDWNTLLAFDGTSPTSKLVSVRMIIKEDRDHIQVESTLRRHNFEAIRVASGKAVVDLPAFSLKNNQPLGSELQGLAYEAIRKQLKKEDENIDFETTYIPLAVAEGMQMAAKAGTSPLDVLKMAQDDPDMLVAVEGGFGARAMLCTAAAWLENRCLPMK